MAFNGHLSAIPGQFGLSKKIPNSACQDLFRHAYSPNIAKIAEKFR